LVRRWDVIGSSVDGSTNDITARNVAEFPLAGETAAEFPLVEGTVGEVGGLVVVTFGMPSTVAVAAAAPVPVPVSTPLPGIWLAFVPVAAAAAADAAAAAAPAARGDGGKAASSLHGVHPTHISYSKTPRDRGNLVHAPRTRFVCSCT